MKREYPSNSYDLTAKYQPTSPHFSLKEIATTLQMIYVSAYVVKEFQDGWIELRKLETQLKVNFFISLL